MFFNSPALLETWHGLERWNESREMHKTTLSSQSSNGGERERARGEETATYLTSSSDKKWTVYVAVGCSDVD